MATGLLNKMIGEVDRVLVYSKFLFCTVDESFMAVVHSADLPLGDSDDIAIPLAKIDRLPRTDSNPQPAHYITM